jgi:hypothetical protein
MAILLETQGQLEEAEPLYREVLSARRRTQGDDHPRTLSSNFNFAGLLWAQGKQAEALESFRQELAGVRRVLGEDHPSTQQSLRNYELLVAHANQ